MTDSSNLFEVPGSQIVSVVWDRRSTAASIRASLGNEVAAVLETGRLLIEAKANLPHGEWLPTLADAGIGEDKAQSYIRIARHPALSNTAHVRYLPQSWGTLAVLAKLPPSEIDAAITDGRITPDTTRAQAQALVDQFNAPDPVLLGEMQAAARCAYGLQGFLSDQRRTGIRDFPWRAAGSIEPPIDAAMIRDAIEVLQDMLASIEGTTP